MKRWIVVVLVSLSLLGCPSEETHHDHGPGRTEGDGHSH
jgi:hypothetical protein